MGAGRARRYAMARAVPRVGSTVGVFSISPEGQPAAEGSLQAIAGGKYWLEPARGNGQVFDSLPWFALDQRPEGFLGRALARAHQGEGLPSRLSDWNDDQILYALTTFGGSSRGDLVFGDRMLADAHSAPRAIVVDQADREERYAQLASAAAAGDAPGSSAGGEQPKFEAVRLLQGESVRVIVKFSPPLQTAPGARWRDLLILEHLSNAVLRDHGVPASASELIEAGGRAFLEVERFDRVGTNGRRRVFSLGTIDDQFIGKRQAWGLSAEFLARESRLPRKDAEHIALIDAFGALIDNSDMHFGNLSFFADGLLDPKLRLAPIYDMSPMRYAPTQEVASPIPEFKIPAAPGYLLNVWPRATEAAIDYWRRAQRLGLGEEMHDAAVTNAKAIEQSLARKQAR